MTRNFWRNLNSKLTTPLSKCTKFRHLYPGKCGYKSETGGIMKNLRESTSHKKVVDYHKQFYRPENLRVIITGRVDPADLFKVMDDVDETIAAKAKDRSTPPFTRPWQVIGI